MAGLLTLDRGIYLPFDSPRVDDLLEPTEQADPPLGVIRISLSPSDGLRTYAIRFAARKTFWTYYLLGRFARDGLYRLPVYD